MTTKPTPPPEKKRAPPTPGEETEALRARRAIRTIDEKIETILGVASQKVTELNGQRALAINSLSKEARELLVQLGVDLKEGKDAAE